MNIFEKMYIYPYNIKKKLETGPRRLGYKDTWGVVLGPKILNLNIVSVLGTTFPVIGTTSLVFGT